MMVRTSRILCKTAKLKINTIIPKKEIKNGEL
jgi:hypothetical protein